MMAKKKAKIEPTLEELQAKKAKRQRGWVRFCAIILAVALTAGMFGMASSGDPTRIPVYPNVVQAAGGNSNNNTPQTPTPQTPAATTPTPSTPSTTPPAAAPEESGGILDTILGFLSGIDFGSILSTITGFVGGLNFDGLGVTIGNGIQSVKDSLLGLLDRIEASLTGKPVISHDAVEYPFAEDADLGSLEAREALVALLNDATAQAETAQYTLQRLTDYTDDGHVSVGDQTEIINQVLSTVNADLSLDVIVGSFVGVGFVDTTVTSDRDATSTVQGMKEEYLLKATELTADDIQIVSANPLSGTYTVALKNVDNPNRRSDCGLTRFTNDYLVQNELADVIQSAVAINDLDFGTLKLTDLIMEYSNIQITFQVNALGRLTSLTYTYTAYGKFTVRTNTVQVIGASTTTTTNTYSNFTYAESYPMG